MKLSEKLIKLRKEKGLSQEEFGNKINVSRQAISKWENDETKPDIEKIQEIVKIFGTSFEYLLNDEIEDFKDNTEIPNKKNRIKFIFKIVLVILCIYILFCVYKFIAFYKFYLTANSFEAENYIIRNHQVSHFNYSGKNSSDIDTYFYEKKIGNKYIQEFYDYIASNPNENKMVPVTIDYCDFDTGMNYSLDLDITTGKYTCNISSVNLSSEELLEGMKESNIIKNRVLGTIPSGFKEIFLASINPQYYYVDIFNRQYRKFYHFNNQKTIVQLSVEGLMEYVTYMDDNSSHHYSYSYDFEQNHFNNFVEPLEQYKDKIIFKE